MTAKERLNDIIKSELFHEDVFDDLNNLGCPRNKAVDNLLSEISTLLSSAILKDFVMKDASILREAKELINHPSKDVRFFAKNIIALME